METELITDTFLVTQDIWIPDTTVIGLEQERKYGTSTASGAVWYFEGERKSNGIG